MNVMTLKSPTIEPSDYARCILASQKVRWDIEDDVIRGRQFNVADKFLPDGLALPHVFPGLSPNELLFVSQIQGRTYANVFGLAERFINAKVLEVSQDYSLGDQVALEALIRFSDEELKHQALFSRIERMMAEAMPEGYAFEADPNAVAAAVLEKSTWAVLGLTLDIELFTQLHYRESIEPDGQLSELFKDVFLFHWREECQHAILDELEWVRHDETLSPQERDQSVDDLIALVGALDGILQAQSTADAAYFSAACGRKIGAQGEALVREGFLKAYRWQYIHSGVQHPRFAKVLGDLITPAQGERISSALATLR